MLELQKECYLNSLHCTESLQKHSKPKHLCFNMIKPSKYLPSSVSRESRMFLMLIDSSHHSSWFPVNWLNFAFEQLKWNTICSVLSYALISGTDPKFFQVFNFNLITILNYNLKTIISTAITISNRIAISIFEI